MENPCKKVKYSDQKEFSEQSNFSASFEDLPDEILEKIFGYLGIRDLCKVGRVSLKWYEISRTPLFWRRVDLNPENNRFLNHNEVYKLIESFPPCVTNFRLNNGKYIYGKINLTEFLVRLQERCPSLKVLMLDTAKLEHYPGKGYPISCVLDAFPRQLQVLALRHSIFKSNCNLSARSPSCVSFIRVLDVARSYEMGRDALILASMLPHLRELRLAGCTLVDDDFIGFYDIIKRLKVLDLEGTLIGNSTYREIWHYGQNLTELYMCGTNIQDFDIKGQDVESFPKLEILCIRGTYVTETGIRMLMGICSNLKSLHTSACVSPEFLSQFSKGSSREIHIDHSKGYCDHFMKVNYLFKY